MATETEKTSGISPTARNMIIGVITTVLVSGTVYLLGFNKKNSGPTKLEKEKATTEAWKTYVIVENGYAKSSAVLLRDAAQYKSYKELFQALRKESDKFLTGLQRLIANEDVDKDMIAVLKRRADNEETSLPPTEKFFDQLDEIMGKTKSGTLSAQQANDSIQLHFAMYNDRAKGMMDRAISEIEDLSKTLSERYHQPFNIDDFLVIQVYKYKRDLLSILKDDKKEIPVTTEYLTGEWNLLAATVTFYADGSWTSSIPSPPSKANGTYELKSNQLTMHGKDSKTGKQTLDVYDLLDVQERSFIMKLNVSPFPTYNFIRK